MEEEKSISINETGSGFDDLVIDEKTTIVSFNNSKYGEVNKEELFQKVEAMKNRENIKVLSINWSSSFEDLKIVSFFPNLEGLLLRGKNLKNVSGIENLKNMVGISIETEDNAIRDIEGIEKLNSVKMTIRITGKNDLEVLKKCQSLKFLRLEGSFNIDFKDYSNLSNLEDLILINRKVEEIKNVNCLKSLKIVDVSYCMKLARFGDNNDNIERLCIQACNKLDLNSIKQLKNLKLLRMVSIKNISDLSFIANISGIKSLDISATTLSKTNMDAIKKSKSLVTVSMPACSNKTIEELAGSNKKILISNANIYFYQGVKISFEEFQKLNDQLFKDNFS